MTVAQRLPDLAKKGYTQSEAARKLGVSRQRVSQLAAKHGLTFRTYAREVPKEQLEALAKRGLTQTEAARELGVPQQRIRSLAAEFGIAFASALMKPRPTTTELGKVLQAARLRRKVSYTRLAELSGLDRHHIAAIEAGRVRRPTARTLQALASCLRAQTSYDDLVRAADSGGRARKPRRGRGVRAARGGRKAPRSRSR